jgi:hypothetical protein
VRVSGIPAALSENCNSINLTKVLALSIEILNALSIIGINHCDERGVTRKEVK